MQKVMMSMSSAVLAVALTGCGQMYRQVPKEQRVTARGQGWDLEIHTETPPGIADKAVCAMKLVEQVRADPSFAAELGARSYNFAKDSEEAVRNPAGVVACATQNQISMPWRLRHCHWPDVLNREYGANRHDDGFYIRTYDCRAQESTVGELAAHFMHEHMHTCGYEDAGGNDGSGLATYVVGSEVEARVGKHNDCPAMSSTQRP